MSVHREVYELITGELQRGAQGLTLSDRGLGQLAERLARLSGDERAEGLLGVLAVLEFLGTQENAAPAVASLLAVFVAVVEQTHLEADQRDAFDRRLKELTGQPADRKLPGTARPEGTVPAGPGARFAVGASLSKRPGAK